MTSPLLPQSRPIVGGSIDLRGCRPRAEMSSEERAADNRRTANRRREKRELRRNALRYILVNAEGALSMTMPPAVRSHLEEIRDDAIKALAGGRRRGARP